MSDKRLSFETENTLCDLEKIGRELELFCESLGLTRKTIFQIKFALEEIFVNIISYGYPENGKHRIEVTMAYENGSLILRIEDDGVPFNPLEVDTPDTKCPIEERKVGGLGIHLTKHLMSMVDYQRKGNRNVLTLKKSVA